MLTPLKRIGAAMLAVASLAGLGACSAAETASHNLSQASDNFEINRRIVFFNGITDKYLLSIEGLCSITADGQDAQLEVTCKTGNDEFKKHYLGLSDNVSYFVEQLDGYETDSYHYRVVYRPETVIPNIDIDTSGNSSQGTTEESDSSND